ncbi:MAG TPA: peptide deformylase [Polyangiaceae bacterium]|nr:peptide deformylase [Polyangiaceae bacterium]
MSPDRTAFDLDDWLAASPAAPSIVQVGATVLRRRATEVPQPLFGTKALSRLIERMVEAMRAAPGVGLAAPQLGVPLRVFVAEDDEARMAHVPAQTRTLRGRTALPLTVVLNPEIVALGADEAMFYEGCLSVRGYGALVRRAAAVGVTAVDHHGRPVAFRVEGWPARIMQHEGDHLDGTLYVDRMISRSFASEAELARLASMDVRDVLGELVDR